MTAAEAAEAAAREVLEADAGTVAARAVAARGLNVQGQKVAPAQRGRTGKAAGPWDEGKHKRDPSGKFAVMAQKQLKDEGLYDGKVDGQVGPKTRKAILAYQEKYGLHRSGQLDDNTRTALQAPPGVKSRAEVRADEAEAAAAKGKGGGKAKSARQKGEEPKEGGKRSAKRRGGTTRSGGSGGTISGEGVLREGDGMDRKRGDGQVRQLQLLLERFGYDLGEGGVDGKLGPATKRAVKRLQQDHGLRADGVAGRHTKRLLELLRRRESKSHGKPTLTADETPVSEAAMVAEVAAHDLLGIAVS